MKIALVHDSFTQLGGAERVIGAFHEMFPEAPIFTLVLDRKLKEKFTDWDIRTSWLQVLYNFIPKLQYLLPFIPAAVASLDFSGYDLVLSSSSGFIKNIRLQKNIVHVNYCHTPTRFLWSDANYVEQEVPRLIRPLIKLFLGWMKKWDYKGAQRVSRFIANSREVQKRIKQYYNRDSEVIYPFVDTDFWHPSLQRRHSEGSLPAGRQVHPTEESLNHGKGILRSAQDNAKDKDYFLIVGRLQAHKKNDLIVQVFNELGLPLHIAGTGRQENYLKSIAKPNITFLGQIPDEQLREQYSGAKAVIFPQVEDFGLVPLEAAACGTATMAFGRGGALETVIPGITGQFFQSYNKDDIKALIVNWDLKKYQTANLLAQAAKFSKQTFKQNIENFLKAK